MDFLTPKIITRFHMSPFAEKAYVCARKVDVSVYWWLDVVVCEAGFGTDIQLANPLRTAPWTCLAERMGEDSVHASNAKWFHIAPATIMNRFPAIVEPPRPNTEEFQICCSTLR